MIVTTFSLFLIYKYFFNFSFTLSLFKYLIQIYSVYEATFVIVFWISNLSVLMEIKGSRIYVT